MKQEYKEAFEEIYEIFNLMPKELIDKIPLNFYNMIKEERDTNYKPNIKEPLENQKLKDETIIILGLIYRDFLCSQQEKKILQKKDAKEIQKIEKEIENEKRKKYNINAIFKDKSTQNEIKMSEQKKIIVYEEKKWYKKIFDLIKKFFARNKIEH